MNKSLSFILSGIGLGLSYVAASAATQAPVAAKHAMVVTAQHLASDIGVRVLENGGNAADAAVAIGYALAVVYPAAGNLGGGGFMTIQMADGRRSFIDFREKAPLGASANMYLDAKGEVIANLSRRGYLAAGVPGTVAGLEYVREHYGSQGRAGLIDPAIALAETGFVLDRGDAAILGQRAAEFKSDAPTAAIFLNRGRPFEAGERLVQSDLALTLREIRDKGRDGFYQGRVAESMVSASQSGHGLFTRDDFAQYKVREMKPVECDYRGYHIVSAPPPSSGGVILCEMFNVVSGYPLKEMGFHSAQAVHYQVEAMRHGYFDRNSYLGDPDFVKNPIDHLISDAHAAEIRAAIDPQKAGVSTVLKMGVAPHEGTNTTHFSVVDRDGNAVSVTYTLNDLFGAVVTVPATGVLLNDEMDDFTSKPGVANLYGLVQGEANAIAPGKTPLSSMSPTIVSKNGDVVMVVGTPGGSRIITTVFQTIINVIDYGMNIQEAVDAPRFHHQWMPDVVYAEPFSFSADTAQLLVAMGYQLKDQDPQNHIAAILVGAPSLAGKMEPGIGIYGANDPRRGTGLAEGD